MRYFSYLADEEKQALFHTAPYEFNNRSNKDTIAHAIGAALYMPATRTTIAEDLANSKLEGLVSVVIDLEDAVGDNQVEAAERQLQQTLLNLERYLFSGRMEQEQLPLIFIRVRSPQQLQRLLDMLEDEIELVTGFVFPKFGLQVGEQYLELISSYNLHKSSQSPVLYGMPILESAEVLYQESRINTLLGLVTLLDRYKDYVLNVRIGATDFSSRFGLRRSPDLTIYDIAVIRDCIADIVNVFGRMENNYVISGPVWEYFRSDRVFKPQLRETPFEESMGLDGRVLRKSYIDRYVDGLIKEVAMDKENGILGKTIIHPTHIKPVQAMYAVTYEEYMDAMHIVQNTHGDYGVMKSHYSNKMNEIKPHLSWANKILIRSKIYGVLHENQNFTGLLAETRQASLI